jgi:hypothetical protein
MGDRFRRLWILDITPQKRLELDPGSIADQHREVWRAVFAADDVRALRGCGGL